jgi:hypothetical protein
MSYEEYIGLIHRNPNLSNAARAQLFTMLQGLNPKIEDASTTEVIVESTGERLRSEYTMSRKKTTPCKSYPLVHTITGTFSFPTTDLKYGGRGDFSGSSYITIDNHTRLNVTSEISIGGWFYFPSEEASVHRLISKASQYTMTITNNVLTANIYISGGTGGGFNWVFEKNKWYHIWMTWKSPTLKFYVDLSLVGTQTRSGTLDTTSNPLHIGSNGASQIAPSGTRMAWISILNKEVDLTWITNHYNGLLDTSGTNIEMTTIPFIQNADPQPDATVNLCGSAP